MSCPRFARVSSELDDDLDQDETDCRRGEHLQLDVAPTETLHKAEDLPVADP